MPKHLTKFAIQYLSLSAVVNNYWLFNFRFEKLDITPKSAQKIKPVLERWMQEAEERYRDVLDCLITCQFKVKHTTNNG